MGDQDAKALEGLSKMFNDPVAYNILPYRHNYTEDGEYVLTAFFLPAYAMKIDPEYMDSRGYTDMIKAREYFEGERKKKSGQVLLDYCAEYCFTPSEALLKQGDGIFDPVILADRLTQLRIQKIGIQPQRVNLEWDCPNADILASGARVLECACGPCIGMGFSPNSGGVPRNWRFLNK